MKKALFILAAVSSLCLSSPVDAQPGKIGIFADAAGGNCNVGFDDYGYIPFYVVHTPTAGARGVRFSAPVPACLIEARWSRDQSLYTITTGNSQSGVTVDYGSCVASPIHVLTIWYFSYGLGSPPCCLYPVLADPSVESGQIEVVDCHGATVFAQGRTNTVNGNANCPCESPLSTNETTWGRIKALYN
jgi:hypothetical protein